MLAGSPLLAIASVSQDFALEEASRILRKRIREDATLASEHPKTPELEAAGTTSFKSGASLI